MSKTVVAALRVPCAFRMATRPPRNLRHAESTPWLHDRLRRSCQTVLPLVRTRFAPRPDLSIGPIALQHKCCPKNNQYRPDPA